MTSVLPDTVWTVGHSTRSLDEFIALLRHYQIEALADVRRFPGSRRLPHFHEDSLRATLPSHGIEYLWLPGMGGRRRPVKGSPNDGWRNSAFMGYADHLATDEFKQAYAQLLELAAQHRTAIMCAEVLWWRCHRSIVSDVLKFDGVDVQHIQDGSHIAAHPYTAPAKELNGALVYAADVGQTLRAR
jgi:uncharacterized protein (DUF488 family)